MGIPRDRILVTCNIERAKLLFLSMFQLSFCVLIISSIIHIIFNISLVLTMDENILYNIIQTFTKN